MSTLKCAVCGGTRTTPPTSMPADSGWVKLLYKVPDGGFLSQGLSLHCVGRACLDCGHVMMFLDPEALEQARAQTGFLPWS